MCGFAGMFGGSPSLDRASVIESMRDALEHRGPDDQGAWMDAEAGLALGHRRLSILDLSAGGVQPMSSRSGRYVIAFNGEIYNHLEMRQALEAGQGEAQASAWRGTSDTETLLEAIERWGFDHALDCTRGMFAFALWDRERGELTLARDRLGEKPLYYGWSQGAFLFASELSALEAFPGFDRSISRQAVGELLRLGYVPAPLSIYEHVYKLEPGAALVLRREEAVAPPAGIPAVDASMDGLALRRWYRLADVVESGASAQLTDDAQAEQACLDTLQVACRRQML